MIFIYIYDNVRHSFSGGVAGQSHQLQPCHQWFGTIGALADCLGAGHGTWAVRIFCCFVTGLNKHFLNLVLNGGFLSHRGTHNSHHPF